MMNTRFLKRPAKIVAILVLMLVSSIVSTGAIVRGTQNFSLSCTGIESNGGRVILSRDNTGSNMERIAFLATDGAGNVIYGPIVEMLPVGDSVEYPRGLFETWSASPAANPLFFSITSEAGNGFARETVYRSRGNCNDLDRSSGVQLTNLNPADQLPGTRLATDAATNNDSLYAPVDVNDLADIFGLQGEGTVSVNRLNVRSGDGVQYRRLNVVTRNTPLTIIGRNEAATWWYVEFGSELERGWVSADFVLLRGDLQYNDVEKLVGAEAIDRGAIEYPRFIFYQDYPIYQQPNAQSLAVCEMAGNVEYNVLGRTSNSDWYQVQVTCNGIPLRGWAQANLGALRRYGQEVPIIQ